MYGRTWEFWCDGCDKRKRERLYGLEAERLAAIEWFKAHDGHKLGGFVTPVQGAEPCEDCQSWHHVDQYQTPRCSRSDGGPQ